MPVSSSKISVGAIKGEISLSRKETSLGTPRVDEDSLFTYSSVVYWYGGIIRLTDCLKERFYEKRPVPKEDLYELVIFPPFLMVYMNSPLSGISPLKLTFVGKNVDVAYAVEIATLFMGDDCYCWCSYACNYFSSK